MLPMSVAASTADNFLSFITLPQFLKAKVKSLLLVGYMPGLDDSGSPVMMQSLGHIS
jgi:hypothetical protein